MPGFLASSAAPFSISTLPSARLNSTDLVTMRLVELVHHLLFELVGAFRQCHGVGAVRGDRAWYLCASGFGQCLAMVYTRARPAERARDVIPFPPRLRDRLDRIDDRLVAGAAAVVAGEMLANCLAARYAAGGQQLLRGRAACRACSSRIAGRCAAANACCRSAISPVSDTPSMVSTRAPSHCTASIRQPRTITPSTPHRAGAADAVLAADMAAGERESRRAGNRPASCAHRRVSRTCLAVHRDADVVDALAHDRASISWRATRRSSTPARCFLTAPVACTSSGGSRSRSSACDRRVDVAAGERRLGAARAHRRRADPEIGEADVLQAACRRRARRRRGPPSHSRRDGARTRRSRCGCRRRAAGTRIAVSTSRGVSAVSNRPLKKSSALTVRAPCGPAISTSPPSASRQAGSSAAGSANAIEPPMVPRLRIAGWPICGSAVAISGAWLRDLGRAFGLRVAHQRADLELSVLERDAVEPADAVDVDEQRGALSRMLSVAIRLWPPASSRGLVLGQAARSRARPSAPSRRRMATASRALLPAGLFWFHCGREPRAVNGPEVSRQWSVIRVRSRGRRPLSDY